MRPLAALLIGFGVTACAAPPAPAGDAPTGGPRIGPLLPGMVVHADETFYDITGANAAELRRAMRAHGPRDDERTWSGRTDWSIRWTFSFSPGRGTCRITDARVELQSLVRLPRWRPPPSAPEALVADWERYVGALRAHEHGHVEIAAEAAREITSAIRRLRTPVCTAISTEANATGRRILERARVRNRDYDTETRHGVGQGAAWPPRWAR
jgi:predicted secreted Zn-dependent protease